MYSVYYYFDKTSTNGYQRCMSTTHEFYITALTDVIIEWISNRNIKCAEIFDNETKKLNLHWKRD